MRKAYNANSDEEGTLKDDHVGQAVREFNNAVNIHDMKNCHEANSLVFTLFLKKAYCLQFYMGQVVYVSVNMMGKSQ